MLDNAPSPTYIGRVFFSLAWISWFWLVSECLFHGMSIIHLLFSIELVVFAVCRFMPENVLLKNNQVPWFKNLQTQHTHLHTLTHKHLTKCNNNKKNNLIMIVIKWIPYIRLAIWGVFFFILLLLLLFK